MIIIRRNWKQNPKFLKVFRKSTVIYRKCKYTQFSKKEVRPVHTQPRVVTAEAHGLAYNPKPELESNQKYSSKTKLKNHKLRMDSKYFYLNYLKPNPNQKPKNVPKNLKYNYIFKILGIFSYNFGKLLEIL